MARDNERPVYYVDGASFHECCFPACQSIVGLRRPATLTQTKQMYMRQGGRDALRCGAAFVFPGEAPRRLEDEHVMGAACKSGDGLAAMAMRWRRAAQVRSWRAAVGPFWAHRIGCSN